MRCTGCGCERKEQCARYYVIAPADGQVHTLENLYSFGSGSIGPDGYVEELVCSERGNWGMFIPIVKTNNDRMNAMSIEEKGKFLYHVMHNMRKAINVQEVIDWLQQPVKEGRF